MNIIECNNPIDQCCKNLKQLIRDEELLSSGDFGKIFTATAYLGKDKLDLVIKETVEKITPNVFDEVFYSQYMSDSGIGPVIYCSYYTIENNNGEDVARIRMLMERMDMNCSDALESDIFSAKEKKEIVFKMMELLRLQIFNYNLFCIDIKPENYLVDKQDLNVKMIDFGKDLCTTEQIYGNRNVFYMLMLAQLYTLVDEKYTNSIVKELTKLDISSKIEEVYDLFLKRNSMIEYYTHINFFGLCKKLKIYTPNNMLRLNNYVKNRYKNIFNSPKSDDITQYIIKIIGTPDSEIVNTYSKFRAIDMLRDILSEYSVEELSRKGIKDITKYILISARTANYEHIYSDIFVKFRTNDPTKLDLLELILSLFDKNSTEEIVNDLFSIELIGNIHYRFSNHRIVCAYLFKKFKKLLFYSQDELNKVF